MTKNTIQIILTTLVLTLLTSSLMAQNCHITGRVAVPELQGKNISVMNLKTGRALATTKIVDSTFALDIEVGEPIVCMLKTDPQNNRPLSYYYLRMVGERGNIYADLITDSLSGTPLNDRLNQYWRKCSYEISVLNAIIKQGQSAISMPESEKERVRQDYDQRYQAFVEFLTKTYEANKTNPVGAFVMEDILDYAEIDYESVLAMLEGAAPVVTTYPQMRTKLSAMEKVSHTAPGKQFIDLDLTDYKTGKPIKLSKVIKGKVALIDFWASWCGPCRREIPNLAKIQEKYGNNKVFVLVSLNVWDKPDAQAKAIKDMKMVWTQLTDSTRNATDTYGVDGIPQILLIGKDGKIIARNLRGEDIEVAVKKALEK